MSLDTCPHEWLRVCQEVYCATSRWVADHPDAAAPALEHLLTTSCAYLRVRLAYDLSQQHAAHGSRDETASGALIRFAPAVWRCQGIDDLVVIDGICGYGHDGQVLYLRDAQHGSGIPAHEIVRYVDDPADPYAPLVTTMQQATIDGARPAPPGAVADGDAESGHQDALALLGALLLPASAPVRVEHHAIEAQRITLALTSTQTTGCCPTCGTASAQCHGSYVRTLADCPWADHRVVLRVRVRRFVCATATCTRRTFAEPLPDLAVRSARRTCRLTARLRQMGMAVGGEAGAKVARAQAQPTSPDTLLRLVQHDVVVPTQAPRVLGIDDWAFKKGHTYGTILIDLEARCPVDLLPDRSADSVAAWLQAHPGAEIVCRDRARVYADGVTRGAPDAIQVADRFHLLENLSTALQAVFAHEQDAIQAALFPAPADPDPLPADPDPLPADPDPPFAALELPPSVSPARRLTRHAARKQENRARRVAQYEAVQDLHAQGYTQRAIAAETGLHRATVAKFIAADTFPERQERPPQPGILDPYKPYLHQRLAAGCQTGMHLFRELQAQGYTGSQARVLGYLAQYRREQGVPPRKHMGEQPVPSRQVRIRHVVGLVLRHADRLQADEQQERARLWQASPTVTQASEVALAFTEMVRQRAGDQLDGWLVQATQSGIAPLVQFATGIRETYAEVRAALDLPWSSGQVEGQINRLKTIKRQMYGRAKFALLRARVLAPG